MIDDDIKRILDCLPHFGIAVSGGSDSMALLTWIASHYDTSGFDVINIEHGIRGNNSLRDTAFVVDYCKKRNINCLVTHVNAPEYSRVNGCTVEQAARILRHGIFADYCRNTGNRILTAHHVADQAETVLMHIARGCGIKGLCGMSVTDEYLIRPLIRTHKHTIDEFNATNSVPFVTDETNADSAYTRNFIRNEVILLVEKKYPAFVNNLLRLSDKARAYEAFIDNFIPQLNVDSEGAIVIDHSDMHDLIVHKTFSKAFAMLGVCADVEERHHKLILNMSDGERLDLPHGLIAYREYGKTVFVRRDNSTSPVSFQFGIGEYDTGYGRLSISREYMPDTKQIDIDKLGDNIVIRTRRDNDKIALDYGSKSVGKLLTDKKIPRRLKDLVPVIASGNNVFAVGDIAIAESVKADANSTNVIHIKWER